MALTDASIYFGPDRRKLLGLLALCCAASGGCMTRLPAIVDPAVQLAQISTLCLRGTLPFANGLSAGTLNVAEEAQCGRSSAANDGRA